jgi:four helix bundle suffix protein
MNTDNHGQTGTGDGEGLIPKHGGYKNTKTWQLADMIYDVTVLFCNKFVDRRSRTHDQMVQAARSGVQNIQEGSVDSAVSKKIEMKLTGIAKGSLDELRRDYQKFLKHRDLPEWPPDVPELVRLKALKVSGLEEFRRWVADEMKLAKSVEKNADGHRLTRTRANVCSPVRAGPCVSVSSEMLPAVLAANGALSLLNVCIFLVSRQLDAQARTFEKEGGFTERLYRRRTQFRQDSDHMS